jgi:transposase
MYSEYLRERILIHHKNHLKSTTIVRTLQEEGLTASVSGVVKFLKKYKETGSDRRRLGSGRPSVISEDMLKIIDEAMSTDDETTATQLQQTLKNTGHTVSLSTILRHRTRLGWTFRGSAYCQLIRDVNKIKRKDWCIKYCNDVMNERLTDVVWTDETSIQLETHRRFCCRKKGQQARPKPR